MPQSKKPKIKTITRLELATMDPDNPLYNLNRMATIPIYQYRVRKRLFETNQLSAKGFLNNDDILVIPALAKRTTDGEIALNDIVHDEINRYLLSNKILESGNELLSFLIDYDDALYTAIIEFPKKGDENVFENEEVQEAVRNAYNNISSKLLDMEIMLTILNT